MASAIVDEPGKLRRHALLVAIALVVNAIGVAAVWAFVASQRSHIASCDASCDSANRAAVTMQASGDGIMALAAVLVFYPLATVAAAAGIGAARRRVERADGFWVAWAYLWPHWLVAWAAVIVSFVGVASDTEAPLNGVATFLVLLVAPIVGARHASKVTARAESLLVIDGA